jgi:putative transposase
VAPFVEDRLSAVPRQPRYRIPDVPQHVVQRGNNRQPTFFAPADYCAYKDFLQRAAIEQRCEIHAYVLMTNHVHVLVTPAANDSLPLLMQSLGRRYVRYVNDSYRRTGTLWEGRYKACLVQTEHYLMACSRYIELNPVRAGIVARAADYPHSSYRHNALGHADSLITAHKSYLALGMDAPSRRVAYRRIFESPSAGTETDEFRAATERCLVVGDERFKDQIEALLSKTVRPGKCGRPRRIAAKIAV